MKKRTKKVLSFGVAALMAATSLPFSALSVSASINKDQTANGGTPYNFVLKEQGTGVQEIQVSKEDVANGDVSKTLDVFIDSEEWADDNYLNQVTLNWIATKDKSFADGGSIDNHLYYDNVFNAEAKSGSHTIDLPNGETVTTLYDGVFCLSPMTYSKKKGWQYTSAKCSCVTRTIACDMIFGKDLVANGDNKVKFTYDYYENVDDYLADKGADKATHKKTKTQECDVLYKEDGTPYITYSYINQGADVAANYVEKTVTEELPRYTTTRFVKNTDGDDCVPDINNYYAWGYLAKDSKDRSKFALNDSDALRFTSFDVVIPKGTDEGTYYVQLCSRNANKEYIPLQTAADFNKVKADQDAKRAESRLEDMSTAIHGKKATETYALPQDASLAVVKIVVGDGKGSGEATTATTAGTTTTSSTTTSSEPQGDKVEWNISKNFYNAGEEEAEVNVTQVNGKTSDGVSGALMVPEATRKILSLPEGFDWDSAFVTGDAYLNLSKVQTNTKDYEKNGRLGFIITGEGFDTPSGDTIATLTMNIADEATVKAAAEAAGLTLKTDAAGKSYYSFPVEWMEDGTDKGISDGKEVDIKRFEYHDENGADIHTTGVAYNAGEINVYVSSEPQGDKVEWNISKNFYNAGEEEAEVTVTQVNGKTSDGVSGALMVPEATRKILSLPEGFDWDSAFVTGDA